MWLDGPGCGPNRRQAHLTCALIPERQGSHLLVSEGQAGRVLQRKAQARQITQATICCSDYFAKADAAEFQEARELLAQWPVTLMAGRTHAKLAVSHSLSMEGSANLRACNPMVIGLPT